jgi:hypothetical protein
MSCNPSTQEAEADWTIQQDPVSKQNIGGEKHYN